MKEFDDMNAKSTAISNNFGSELNGQK